MNRRKRVLLSFLQLLSVALFVLTDGVAPRTISHDDWSRDGLRDPPVQGDDMVVLDNRFCRQQAKQAVLANDDGEDKKTECASWTVSATGFGADNTSTIHIPAVVPGDLLTDLETNRVIDDPFFGLNWKDPKQMNIWSNRVWNYTTTFVLPEAWDPHTEEVLLVLDGIKMGANVYLNEQLLLTATDQFRRYTIALVESGALRLSSNKVPDHSYNTLIVSFDPTIPTGGRFMACTGGWDWAPYSDAPRTRDTNARVLSLGLVKSVYLVRVSSAAITAVVPHTFYGARSDSFLSSSSSSLVVHESLVDGQHEGFRVNVRVHLWAPLSKSTRGVLHVQGLWGGHATTSAAVEFRGETNVTLTVTAEAKHILLWWPVGMGPNRTTEFSERPLYKVMVQFVPTTGGNVSTLRRTMDSDGKPIEKEIIQQSTRIVQDSRKIGFRHFALVTTNDTDASQRHFAQNQEGTGFHGMYFRVNGVAMYSRGANMIPMENLEGRLNAQAHVQLIKSAILARMNTLRVWGGGIFLPRAWYDACDRWGVLVYHDMMYAQEGHGVFTENLIQEVEFRHNVRLLSNHPSIVIWDGCNECQVIMDEASGIYAKFVMTIVSEEDRSRVVWPSSPAAGWKSGVDRLTCMPTGSMLVTPNRSEVSRSIEVHGPYAHGSGWPAVNGADELHPLDPLMPIKIKPDPTAMGIAHPSVFASEFGCPTMSSFESMSATLRPQHWSLHGGAPADTCSGGWHKVCTGGNAMSQRNYPCDNIILAFFHVEDGYFEAVGKQSFMRQLYHCMLGQALYMKNLIESRRSTNELGHIVWQLNEIWPTGGWGSLEYGNPASPGQVLGGRWKALHYFFRSTVFADILVTCSGHDGQCYIRNDSIEAFRGSIYIKSINIETGITSWKDTIQNVTLPPGPGSLNVFHTPIDDERLDGSTHFLELRVLDLSLRVMALNSVFLKLPKEIENLPCHGSLRLRVGDHALDDGTVRIDVLSDVPVSLFVTLTTLATGYFSDNAFAVVGGVHTVYFVPFGKLDRQLLSKSLRVEDLAMYSSRCRASS